MDKDVAGLWSKELRSGRWVKGKGYMKRRWGSSLILHCPLGVLVEVAIAEGIRTEVKFVDGGETGDTYWTYDGYSATLPPFLCGWAGQPEGWLLTGWGVVVPDVLVDEINAGPVETYYKHGQPVPLSEVNDFTFVDFNTIADIVELNYL